MNITINYEGQSKAVALFFASNSHTFFYFYVSITVKVRANTNFTKIFQAAEVLRLYFDYLSLIDNII